MGKLQFTRKKVGTLTLGEKLRKLRNDFRISLSDVAKATKVQAKYLEYLEAGAYDKLPADVYTRGFLRSYARYLNVDEEALLRLYDRERNVHKNLGGEPQEGFTHRKMIPISSLVITPRAVVLTLTALVVVGVFVYLYQEFYRFAAEPRLLITEPESGASVEASEITVRGETDRGAQVTINGEAVFVNPDGHFSDTLTLKPGVNPIVVRSLNRFDREKTETLQVEARFTAEAQPDSATLREELSAPKPVSLDIRASVAGSVTITADGKEVFRGRMERDEVRHVDAEGEVRVSAGSADTVFVKRAGTEESEVPLAQEPGPGEAVFGPPGESSVNTVE